MSYKRRQENKFKTSLCGRIKEEFPGSMVLHIDEFQGCPDLLVLYRDKWAVLEGKDSCDAPHRPNQDYYIELMDTMSFARFVYPENEEEVIDELHKAFGTRRKTRLSRC